MRKKLVAANWKMHGSRSMADGLMEDLIKANPAEGVDVLVLPPYPYLAQLVDKYGGSGVGFGAQDVSEHQGQGAYTGEVSAPMVADIGCRWALVGHSERRHHHTESNEKVARKFAAALAAGLTPILCVGETLHQREAGQTMEVIQQQMHAVLALNGIACFDTAVIAYEPVWAIGTGQTATPEQAQEVHAFIRSQLAQQDAMIARLTRLLYGGSVKAANAAELFAQPDVDGGLIGGASLVASEFLAICHAAR
ncbi:triose-phosphate isomerase [Dyella choica]|uniref:Triosephosphate isomerase n=1 Tax=Dyella choica TaxID=1927959 RepID=A0A3S0PK13_9GAMM|nr:triose-phosphate isomerase [Dyella choica]RUL72422.1 triose-phosphate isomerase [Dyella choica]